MADATAIRRDNLEALLGIAGVGMFTAGLDLRVRTINREAEQLLGLQPGQGVGLSCREILGPALCSEGCAFRRTLHDRKPRSDWRVNVVSATGDERELSLHTVFLDAEDEADRQVAIALRDVTEADRLRRALRDRWHFHGLLCVSGKMKEIVTLVRELAPYDATVLVLGESGTGKELIAQAVHAESPRRERPFVTVNCSAYSEGLLESELFGHVRGSFTGAVQDRDGRFVAGQGGTVFLDEIGEISPKIQVKLLRVLQERAIERVGDQRPVPVDMRVVAATNRDLRAEVRAGRFREDLYYRLNVITVDLPPLRERREDIPVLAEHFLLKYSERTGKQVTTFADEALEALLRHDWPGNVRELENAVEHAVVRARTPVVLAHDLPHRGTGSGDIDVGAGVSLEARIDAALAATNGKIGRAAEILGIHRTTVWRHLRKRHGA